MSKDIARQLKLRKFTEAGAHQIEVCMVRQGVQVFAPTIQTTFSGRYITSSLGCNKSLSRSRRIFPHLSMSKVEEKKTKNSGKAYCKENVKIEKIEAM